MQVIYLTAEEILRLHHQIIEDFGGGHGVRDENRLKSLVDAPKQHVFGNEQYPDVYKKAAVYLRNIIGDHFFTDANKRTAVTVCGIFLMRNGHELIADPIELETFTINVAIAHLSIEEIVNWLSAHTA